MLYQISKHTHIFKYTAVILAVLVLLGAPKPAFAFTDITACDTPIPVGIDDVPSPNQLICPIIKILNVVVLVAGAIFVAIVFLSAYKFAMSQGDPKAAAGAKDTLTLAIFGFIAVISIYAILIIAKNLLGLNTSVLDPFYNFSRAWDDLLNWASVNTNVGP